MMWLLIINLSFSKAIIIAEFSTTILTMIAYLQWSKQAISLPLIYWYFNKFNCNKGHWLDMSVASFEKISKKYRGNQNMSNIKYFFIWVELLYFKQSIIENYSNKNKCYLNAYHFLSYYFPFNFLSAIMSPLTLQRLY